jgi:hypothetical protein
MNLTAEQLQALEKGEPISLVVEGRDCVLLSSQVYDHLREAIDDWDPSTMQRHMAEMMAEDWNDSAMGVYDE